MGKKLCCLLLSAVLILTGVFPVLGAELQESAQEALPGRTGEGESSGTAEADGQEIEYYYSPVFRNEDGMTNLLRKSQSGSGLTQRSGARLSSSESAAITKAADTMRSNMVKRVKKVEFSIRLPRGMTYRTLADAIMDEAGKETSHSWEGDYLAYTLDSYYYSVWTQDGSTYYYSFDINYRTTKAQEDRVTSKVASVLKSFSFSSSTPEYQKIKKIYDYICKNTVYDYYHLYTNPYYGLMYTAYGALIDKTAVCQGYALLLYRMLREAGIPCRAVCGYSSGENHMWNIVSIGGTYYNADSTWDAGSSSYQYFLKGNTTFNRDHVRDSGFNTSAYKTATKDYVVTSKDTAKYKLDAPKLTGTASAAFNKLEIKWNKVSHAAGYNVYVKSSGKWRKIGTTTGTSFTYTVGTDVNYRFTVAAYQMSGKKQVEGPYNTKGIVGKTSLGKPSISSITKASRGLKLTWKKVAGASGYIVYRYDNGKWVRKKKLTGLSVTDTTAKAGKTYKYRVKAYRKGSVKIAYSAASSTVSKKR